MKITFLGTNGWYDTSVGNTICVLVETSGAYVVFDAGNGIYKLDRHVEGNKPIYVFLSHFHLDHIVGIHVLSKFRFPQGIRLYGPPGIADALAMLAREPFTAPLDTLRTEVSVEALDGGSGKRSFEGVTVEYRTLHHTSLCYGYRIIGNGGKCVAYCTDTGVCDGLYYLARDADLLISECSLAPGVVDGMWPHLNPDQAATLAREAGALRLAMVHFDASVYQGAGDRAQAEMCAKRIFSNVMAAQDGQTIII